MNPIKRNQLLPVFLLGLLLLSGCTTPAQPPSQIPNPASKYCADQGHKLEIRTDETGGQYGVCILANNTECEEWKYFRGECG